MSIERVVGILVGIVLGIVVVIIFVFYGSEQTIDAPSIDENQPAQRQADPPQRR